MPTAEPGNTKRWAGPAIVAGLLLLACFLLFATPAEDNDCFWHVATGQWIWKHQSLPSIDPFTHTVKAPEAGSAAAATLRSRLSQSWLGELALAAAWGMRGITGIILLKALAFTATLALMYRWMRRSANLPTTAVCLLLTIAHLHQYPGNGPGIFSPLFMTALLSLLEEIRKSGRIAKLQGVALPAVMLFWANIDASYAIGAMVILIYLLFYLLSPPTHSFGPTWKIPVLMTLAVAASLANPGGLTGVREVFGSLQQTGEINSPELLPTIQATVEYGMHYPAYWTALFAVALIGLFRYKAMELPHLFSLFFLAAISITSVRFSPFLLLASPLAAIYIPEIPKILLRGLAVATAIFLGTNLNWSRVCRFETNRLNPVGAAAFVRLNLPAQNIFNYRDWGGFLLLNLPGYKTFIDGRNIDESVLRRYREALGQNSWKEVFTEFNVNTVIMPGAGRWSPATYPLAMSLATGSSWTLVYSDAIALVFVRNIPQNQPVISHYAKDKSEVQKHIIALLDLFPPLSATKAEYWISRGNAQMMLSEHAPAAASFRQALAIDPANEWAQMMLRNAPR